MRESPPGARAVPDGRHEDGSALPAFAGPCPRVVPVPWAARGVGDFADRHEARGRGVLSDAETNTTQLDSTEYLGCDRTPRLLLAPGDNPRLCWRVKSWRCQQGSRIVSAASAGLRCGQHVRGCGLLYLYRQWFRHPQPWWSRPFRIDVCSMFARMSRYSPAARGIRSPSRMRATARNGR